MTKRRRRKKREAATNQQSSVSSGEAATGSSVGQHSQRSSITAFRREEIISFAGPVPHPGILRQYEDLIPGAADRIIKMAEGEAQHRRMCEKYELEMQWKHRLWGTGSGVIVATLGLGAAVLCAVFNHEIAAGVIGGSTLVSLVSVFVVGSRRQPKEAAKQREQPETEQLRFPI